MMDYRDTLIQTLRLDIVRLQRAREIRDSKIARVPRYFVFGHERHEEAGGFWDFVEAVGDMDHALDIVRQFDRGQIVDLHEEEITIYDNGEVVGNGAIMFEPLKPQDGATNGAA